MSKRPHPCFSLAYLSLMLLNLLPAIYYCFIFQSHSFNISFLFYSSDLISLRRVSLLKNCVYSFYVQFKFVCACFFVVCVFGLFVVVGAADVLANHRVKPQSSGFRAERSRPVKDGSKIYCAGDCNQQTRAKGVYENYYQREAVEKGSGIVCWHLGSSISHSFFPL